MFCTATLDNGTRLIGELNDSLGSVTIGFWIGTGQRNEKSGEAGISHFIEHMLFKGTDTRSAKDISVEMDEIGGQINAFTAKEYTCFYTRCLNSDVDTALDILGDILTRSKFDDEETAREKGVVIEEINMVNDTPEDLVHDLLCEAYFGAQPLAKPILGTRRSVSTFTGDKIRAYMRRRYAPGRLVVAVAGSFDFDHIVARVSELVSDWPFPGDGAPNIEPASVPLEAGRKLVKRKTEQMHLCLAWPSVPQSNDLFYPTLVFSNLFGGGMSSRLFQEIREARGLAYSVYSYPSQFLDCGYFAVYAGMTAVQSGKVISIVGDEIADLLSNGAREDELRRGKNQLRGSFILSAESGSNRMMSIGRNYLQTGVALTREEVLAKIDAVTREDLMAVTRLMFASSPAVAAIGSAAGIEAAMNALAK